MIPARVPDVTFKTRVLNESLGGPNPYEWKDLTSKEVFAGKRIVVVGLPGAFTPACSENHLPGYERLHADFERLGVQRIVCVSVNDAFVMFQWAKSRSIETILMLPDGNAAFTRRMGMLVDRSGHGMGMRSWRYSMYVDNGVIRKVFAEPDIGDNPDGIGVTVSDAETMLGYLTSAQSEHHDDA